MKLSWFECRFLAKKLQEIAKDPNATDYERLKCSELLPLFKRIADVHHSPDGRERDMEVPLETQLDEKIAELVNLEIKIDKKTDTLEKVYLNATKPFWMFFIDLVKLILSLSAVCAICYTISKVIPQEWAIWMPIPIIAILGVVYLVQMYYESWHHSHWK